MTWGTNQYKLGLKRCVKYIKSRSEFESMRKTKGFTNPIEMLAVRLNLEEQFLRGKSISVCALDSENEVLYLLSHLRNVFWFLVFLYLFNTYCMPTKVPN